MQLHCALLKEILLLATMQGSDKFDFYLSMSNVTLNDIGSYVAKVEVIHPETGSYSSIKKIITLTVESVNGKRKGVVFCITTLRI